MAGGLERELKLPGASKIPSLYRAHQAGSQ